jgi:hypothetical protein
MPQERLDILDWRPDFKKIPYDEDDSYPTEHSAYLVRDAITEELFPFVYKLQTEQGLRRTCEFISWEPIVLVHLIKTASYTIN